MKISLNSVASTRGHRGPIALLLGAAAVALGCGGGGTESAPPALVHQSHAPLCEDLVGAEDPRALFQHALVDPSAVSAAVVFGDMEPRAPQEVINFELGFYVPENAPLAAPTDLYIESIVRTDHADAGISDWGIDNHVCATVGEDGVRRPAVLGNFAHVTTLAPVLQELFDAELAALEAGQTSAVACWEGGCGLNFNRLRDNIGDPERVLVIAGGDALGTAGRVGDVGPAGVDTNLIDRRLNDYEGNFAINPNRLGAEEGHGAGWRYGACFYEYFPPQLRAAYLSKIQVMGEPRVSASSPCGTLEVDVPGTAAGVWATTDLAGQSMSTDFSGIELDAYLSEILVLAKHPARPETTLMLSTPIPRLAQSGDSINAYEIEASVPDDANAQNFINVDLALVEPGPVYCYAGTRVGAFVWAYYLLQLSASRETLTLERVESDCRPTPHAARAFSPESDQHFQFVR